MPASAAPPATPTLTAADIEAADPSVGANPSQAELTSLGLGSSDLSMLPVFMQYAAQNGGGVNSTMAASAPYQWLAQNGWLQGDSGGDSVTGGYKAEGVQPGGTYNAQDPYNLGAGYGSDQGNQTMVLSGPNPYGYSTIGAQDVKEIQSPTQDPSAFGTSAYGTPTVDKNDLESNQDIWSKFIVPGMQLAAGLAFSGGLGDITGGASTLGTGVYNAASGAVQGLAGGSSPTQIAEGVGAGLAGSYLGSQAGSLGLPSSVTQFFNPAVQTALQLASGQKPNPYSLVGPAVKYGLSNLG